LCDPATIDHINTYHAAVINKPQIHYLISFVSSISVFS
jgi:hypothetical protein